MKIFSKCITVNIYKLLICIAKIFIWTTLKVIFSIFIIFCSLRFQIFKYCPIIINHTSMEILFTFQLKKLMLKTGFVVHDHILYDNESVFWHCMHVNLLSGIPKTKTWTFITHNKSTLNIVVELDFYTKLNAFNSDRLSQTKCTKNTWRGIKVWLLTFLRPKQTSWNCVPVFPVSEGSDGHKTSAGLLHTFWPFIIHLSQTIGRFFSNVWLFVQPRATTECFRSTIHNTLPMHFKSLIWL